MADKKAKAAAAAAAAAEQTEQPTADPQPKAEPKQKTPEQQAAAMRRQAGELRRSAQLVGEAEGGPLATRAAQLEQDADALSPKKSGKSSEPRPTCKGVKKDGTPCTAKAMEGSEYCTDHRPVRSRFTDEEWAAFQAIDTATIVELIGWGRALKLAKEAVAASKQ